MKKKLNCEVDCAACAAKVEEAIRKVDGVEDAKINFLTQKLILSYAEEDFDKVLKAINKAAKKVEPDAVISV